MSSQRSLEEDPAGLCAGPGLCIAESSAERLCGDEKRPAETKNTKRVIARNEAIST